MNFKDIFQNLNTIWDRQQLRSQSGIKLEQSREYKIEDKAINIFWNTDNIFFCYLANHTEKITKKFNIKNIKKKKRNKNFLLSNNYFQIWKVINQETNY